jgi:hypothetical protein
MACEPSSIDRLMEYQRLVTRLETLMELWKLGHVPSFDDLEAARGDLEMFAPDFAHEAQPVMTASGEAVTALMDRLRTAKGAA